MKPRGALLLIGSFLALSGCCDNRPKAAEVISPKTVPQIALKAPILAQTSVMSYGKGTRGIEDGYIGFEGKIYNPNSVPITNVRVRWNVYTTDPKYRQLFSGGAYGESCDVFFAYIPANTTYDYKTEKIGYRSAGVMESLGEERKDAPMNLKPEITFAPES